MRTPARIDSFVMAPAIVLLAGRGLAAAVGQVGEPSDHRSGQVDHD